MPDVKPIPEGYHTVTPSLMVDDGVRAMDFYKRAFGAVETVRMLTPDGKLSHGEMKIGDSKFMLSEAAVYGMRSPQGLGGTPVGLYVYVQDADKVFNQAVAAGATAKMPIMDMFWGDRVGAVVDPFGHQWSVATHKVDKTPEEIERGAREFHANMARRAGG